MLYFHIKIMINQENRNFSSENDKVCDSSVNKGVDEEKEEEIIMEKCVPWFPIEQQKKELKKVMVDRLSSLHDSLLLHILSFLTFPEAVCTSILSTRWKSMLTLLSTLTFHNRNCLPKNIRPFVERVTITLENYRAGNMKKFAVDFMYDGLYASQVDKWILLALQNQVEHLELHLHLCSRINNPPYTLPHYVYSAPSIVNLNLVNCNLGLNGAVEWRSLKNLSMTQVDLTKEAIEIILSGSPVLEFLKIIACRGISNLNINSESVKTLVIQNCDAEDMHRYLQISAPFIQSLHILGTSIGRRFKVKSFSSVVTANLHFSCHFPCDSVKELLESLHHVKEINLGPYCIQMLSMWEMTGMPTSPTNWKTLVLNAHLDGMDKPGILRLLLNSPRIESLTVNRTLVGCLDGRITCRISKVCAIMLPRLKTVKFTGCPGFCGLGPPTLELIGFLLENANILEKLIIVVMPGIDYRQDYEVLQSLPRSSPHVEIVFRRQIV